MDSNEVFVPFKTKIIAICNHKGGVGKTTTSINLASCLSALGKYVLVVDMDPQANASMHIGAVHPAKVVHNLSEMLANPKSDVQAYVHEDTSIDGVSLIYATITLGSIDELLRNEYPRPNEVLKERLAPLIGLYHYIILDCPPSLQLLTMNAIAAATHYMIPVESGAPYGIFGLADLKNRIERLHSINPTLEFLGALLLRHDPRQILCRENEENAIQLFGKLAPITIGVSSKVNQSAAFKRSLRDVDRNNKISKQYQELANWVDATIGEEA